MNAGPVAIRFKRSLVQTLFICALAAAGASTIIADPSHLQSLFAPVAAWSGYRKDFIAFYSASGMIASGSGSAIYHVQAISRYETQVAGHPVGDHGYMAYLNPPVFAAALVPLTFMSLERAYQVWTLFNAALLGIDVWMLWRLGAELQARTRLLLVLAFLSFLPVVDGLLLGQFSLILVTAWAGAYLLLCAGHPVRAGACLAALLVKPEMLIPVLLVLAVKRRWRVFAGFIPVAVLAAIISLASVGLSAALRYPEYVLASAASPASATKSNAMFDWNGIVAMVWGQPSRVPIATLIMILLSVVSLVATWYIWRDRFQPGSRRFAAQWMALTVATVMIDPQLHLQDTVLLALPAAALYAKSVRYDRALLGGLIAIAWLLIAFGPLPNERLHVDAFAIFVLAATTAVIVRFRHRARGAVMATICVGH